MGEQGVNLLTVEKKREKKISNFLALSILGLIITVFITVSLLLYMLFLKTIISGVTNKESNALVTLNTLNSKRVKFLTLSERLSGIQKIVSQNAEFTKRLAVVSENIPQSIFAQDISEDKNKITIKIESADLGVMNTYLENNLKQLALKEKSQIRSITIQDFGINIETGAYVTTIEFIFN